MVWMMWRCARLPLQVTGPGGGVGRGLCVSIPVSWEALPKLQSGAQWTIKTALQHLESEREDPWAGYWKAKQTLAAAMRAISYKPS